MNRPLDPPQTRSAAPAEADEAGLRRLLLGQVSEAERAHLEEVYFTSVDAFDRLLTAEEQLADEYVSGALTAAERDAFERRFALTPAGRRRIQSARAFHQALGELARIASPDDERWRRRTFVWRALATATAVASVAAIALVTIEMRRLTHEAAGLRAERASLLERHDTLRREVEALTSRTALIADSRAEFSCTQGLNNWYYGFYDGPFHSSDFRLMTQCIEDRFYGPGSSWWTDPSRYWTSIGAAVWFPNGPKSCGRLPVEHWAVRRWISEVSGTVTVSGTVRSLLGEFDGFVAHILVGGKSVWSLAVPPGGPAASPIPYRTTFAVDRGAPVDFAIQPRWSDCNDHAEVLIAISSDAPLQTRPSAP